MCSKTILCCFGPVAPGKPTGCECDFSGLGFLDHLNQGFVYQENKFKSFAHLQKGNSFLAKSFKKTYEALTILITNPSSDQRGCREDYRSGTPLGITVFLD